MASNGLCCAICSDIYEDSTDICSTRCGHIYHMSCLQQWIIRSNSCPMCNERNPEPHRIYLDIEVFNQPATLNASPENDRRENTVVIRGVHPTQITTPVYTLIHQLIVAMQVNIVENDIKNITKLENGENKRNISVLVAFKTSQHKELFLQHRHKLKNKPEILKIRIYELLSAETEALLLYSQKLKKFDYKIIYVENDKVYVRKDRNLQSINVLSQDQVDNLCVQQTNNGVETSINNDQGRSEPLYRNKDILTLFQYSQKLKNFGYKKVFIKNNKVFVKKNVNSQQINILSKEQIDTLCVQFTNNTEVASGSNYQNPNANNSQGRYNQLNNKETEALFQYCQKLKLFGYKIIFIENNKIFGKKNRKSQRINIVSKEQVDCLCFQPINNTEVASTSNNQNINEIPSINCSHRSYQLNNNTETEALFQYSQKLKNFGYKRVFIENNEIFVKKFKKSQRIAILSKKQVDNLCVQRENNIEMPSASNNNQNRAVSSSHRSSVQQNNKELQNLYAQRTNNFEEASTSNIRNYIDIHPAEDCLWSLEYQFQNREAQELWKYSQKLKNVGYETILDDNKVYVDKIFDSLHPLIKIVSKNQVDYLYIEETSRGQNLPRLPYTNTEMQELFEYSKKLQKFGFIITFENNKVSAKKRYSRPININSRTEVNDLIYAHERRTLKGESKCVIN